MQTAASSRSSPEKPSRKYLLASSIAVLAGTALGFVLPHPWRVAPAAIGALAIPVAFYSLCVVAWRNRHLVARYYWGDDSHLIPNARSIIPGHRSKQTWAAVSVMIVSLIAAAFALVPNLLHVFNVK